MVFFLLGITYVGAQQSFSVTGTVRDFHDKTVLKQAKIQLGTRASVSDAKGRFTFKNIPAGTHLLTVSHPECAPFSQVLDVTKDIDLIIHLEHHTGDIEAVTLHGNHRKMGSVVIQTLSQQDISRNSTENLGNLLSSISGVTALKTGNNISKPVIHGLYGTRVSIINNGVKMAEQEWGVEHAPNVDINQFEHIDVVKGVAALKYGNESVGGVVVLEPAVIARKDTVQGSVKFSSISNGRGGEVWADAAKTWDNQWFVKAGGAYKKLGDQYVPGHTLQNTGAEVSSFNFSAGRQAFAEGFNVSYSGIQQNFGIFRGAHLGGAEDYYLATNFGQPFYLDNFSYDILNPRQDVRHHIAKIAAYKRFSEIGKLSFQYSFQLNDRKEFDVRRGELNELPTMDMRLITQSATLNHLLERANWSLESGVSGSIQDNFPDPATKARRLIPDYYRYDAGVFSVFKYRLNPKLSTEAGARYDFSRFDSYKYYDGSEWDEKYAALFAKFFISENDSRVLARPVLDYHNFSANLGLNYKPVNNLDITFNLSRTERAPNAAELFADGLHHSAAIIEKGDLRINKEEIFSLNLSALWKADVLGGFTLEANPYLLYSDSFINQVPTGFQDSNRGGAFSVWTFQQVKARIFGIDADAQLSFSDQLKWISSFSALRGDDLSTNEPLILMMPANWRNSIEYNFKGKSGFYLRLENESVFRQKRFPMRNINVTFIENGNVVTKEVDYSTPPPSYTVFNAALGVDLFKNINFNFRINNIFNAEYREYLNRLRFFMPEPGRDFVATIQFKF